jgi:hypothetical protein
VLQIVEDVSQAIQYRVLYFEILSINQASLSIYFNLMSEHHSLGSLVQSGTSILAFHDLILMFSEEIRKKSGSQR